MFHIPALITFGLGYGLVKVVQSIQEDREYEARRRHNNRLANEQAIYEAQILKKQMEKRKNEIVLAFKEVKIKRNHFKIEIKKLLRLKNLHTKNSSTSQIIKRNIALLKIDKKQQTVKMNALEKELNKIGYSFQRNNNV